LDKLLPQDLQKTDSFYFSSNMFVLRKPAVAFDKTKGAIPLFGIAPENTARRQKDILRLMPTLSFCLRDSTEHIACLAPSAPILNGILQSFLRFLSRRIQKTSME